MNLVVMCGRLTKDPEVRYTTGDSPKAVARWSLAVDRQYKGRDGKTEADFFNCVAFGKTAEHLEKYWRKGMKMLLEGRLQNDDYTNRDGQKVRNVQIVVDQVEFVEKKEGGPVSDQKAQEDFAAIQNMEDEGIPFSF